jgi:hypothetical protein
VHELEARIAGERRDSAWVDARQERVKHPHLMTRARERFDDMGSDEAGTAGNQDTHGPEIMSIPGRRSATPRVFINS